MKTNQAHFPPNFGAAAFQGSSYELELFRSVLQGIVQNPSNCGMNATAIVDLAMEVTGTAVARLRDTSDLEDSASTEPNNMLTPPTDGENT